MVSAELTHVLQQIRDDFGPLGQFLDRLYAGQVQPSDYVALIRQETEVHVPGARCESVNAQGVSCEWVAAPGVTGAACLLFLHGGGWARGSTNLYREFMCQLSATAGRRVLGVNYRLAPEAPFPAGLEDCVRVYQWLLAQGSAPHQIAILGDSAGGNLTLATALKLRELQLPLPAALVCLSAPLDLALTGASHRTHQAVDPLFGGNRLLVWSVQAYLNGVDPKTPLASPIYADLAGLPPLLIQVGSAEVLLDDSVRLAERARAAGVDVTLEVWDAMPHVFQFYPELPEAGQAFAHIGAFIQRYLKT